MVEEEDCDGAVEEDYEDAVDFQSLWLEYADLQAARLAQAAVPAAQPGKEKDCDGAVDFQSLWLKYADLQAASLAQAAVPAAQPARLAAQVARPPRPELWGPGSFLLVLYVLFFLVVGVGVTDKDCVSESGQFSNEDLSLLRERMNVLNPNGQLLISKAITWSTSVDELTRYAAITWIYEFVKHGGDQVVPYYADILGAVLHCISDKEEKIRVVARDTNEALRAIEVDATKGFDAGVVLSVARRQLSSDQATTRSEAMHFISNLLMRPRIQLLLYMDDILVSLSQSLSHPSDQVISVVKEMNACILKVRKDIEHFSQLVVFLAQEKYEE